LEVEHVRVYFSALKAVDDVSLRVDHGEILGLIGPNGAGKTTLMNVMSGFQRLTAGRVVMDGRAVTRLSPGRMVQLGVGRTFQAGRLFDGLTVFENVEVGALGTGVSPRKARNRTWELLKRMDLAERWHLRAGALPFGHQRRLGIIRALSTDPRFLLLDEPAAGLNEAETDELLRAIGSIRHDYGCGIVVIEHDMRLIMGLCDRIHVLDHGKSICSGSPRDVRREPAVIAAYLGRAKEAANAGA
jgi:branched-chain amino acid transport system ATP-binding protein